MAMLPEHKRTGVTTPLGLFLSVSSFRPSLESVPRPWRIARTDLGPTGVPVLYRLAACEWPTGNRATKRPSFGAQRRDSYAGSGSDRPEGGEATGQD